MQATGVRSFSQSVAAAPKPRSPFTAAAAPARRSVAVSAGLTAQVRRLCLRAFHPFFAGARAGTLPVGVAACALQQLGTQLVQHPHASRPSVLLPPGPVQKENPFAEELKATAKYIAQRGRGILASDESNATTGALGAGGRPCATRAPTAALAAARVASCRKAAWQKCWLGPQCLVPVRPASTGTCPGF